MADAAAYSPSVRVTKDSTSSPGPPTVTRQAAGLEMTKEETQGFGQVYGTVLGEVINEAVDAAGLSFDDVDLVIPHNVNMVSWRQTIKEMEAAPEKFFLDNVAHYSHTYASDVFVNYTTLRDQDRLADGRYYVLVSVGLGATFGAMVIRHRKR
jgi:3-oxoacyl-[acyl-carrier-protein] synthase-3